MPRYFTLIEARRYLPEVESAIREALDAKKTLEEAEREIHALVEKVMFAGGMVVDREAATRTRQRKDLSSAALGRIFEQLREIGCEIKDLDIGLIDFPTLYQGREVCLCWQLGESDINFWHGPDEGFAGRKPIDAAFARQCRGER